MSRFVRHDWRLDELRAIGFADVAVWSYWSRHFAYLGDPQVLLVARK